MPKIGIRQYHRTILWFWPNRTRDCCFTNIFPWRLIPGTLQNHRVFLWWLTKNGDVIYDIDDGLFGLSARGVAFQLETPWSNYDQLGSAMLRYYPLLNRHFYVFLLSRVWYNTIAKVGTSYHRPIRVSEQIKFVDVYLHICMYFDWRWTDLLSKSASIQIWQNANMDIVMQIAWQPAPAPRRTY